MKKLLILPLLLLLSGCVTYYYPETPLEEVVYYGGDDPSYVVYTDGYYGAAYYPWSSLDYFYWGYNPYPRYGFSYGYAGFGINYGYSPWYYQHSYYGHHSRWYASYYHHPYYPWRPHHGYRHNYQKPHDNGHDRYAGNDHNDRRDRDDEYEDTDDRRRGNGHSDRYNAAPVSRYVSTAPSGHTGDRGLVIRNRQSKKTGKSRVEPVRTVSVQSVNVTSSEARTSQQNYRSRQTNGEVRYRSNAKQTRSRTGPVESSSSSKGIVITTPPSRNVVATGNGHRSAQSTPVKSTRTLTRQPPARSDSSPGAASRSKASSRNSSRAAPNTASFTTSRHRPSKQSRPSHREHLN